MALALCACLCAAACEGTEVGNPVEETPLALTARSSDPDRVQLGTDAGAEPDAGAGASTRIDALWVVLGDLRFVMDGDCSSDRDTRVTVRGPIVAELSHDPDELTALLADGAYCRVRIPLARASASDADGGVPDALLDHSVLIEGTRADGVPFRILSRDKRELELRTRGEPFTLGGAGRALILSFDVATWLDGLDLDGATPGASGEVLIDETSERTRLAAFEDDLAASLRLYRDVDADGSLDASDLDAELAASP